MMLYFTFFAFLDKVFVWEYVQRAHVESNAVPADQGYLVSIMSERFFFK